MKRSLVDVLGRILWAFVVAGSAGIEVFQQDNPAIRGAFIMGAVIFTGTLLMMKANDILRCIQGRG